MTLHVLPKDFLSWWKQDCFLTSQRCFSPMEMALGLAVPSLCSWIHPWAVRALLGGWDEKLPLFAVQSSRTKGQQIQVPAPASPLPGSEWRD